LLAAKECCDLPVMTSCAYGEDGKLLTGATPAAMAALAEGMGALALGVNCSLGPKQLMPIVRELLECASVPVIFKPNAGLPSVVNGEIVYDVTPDEFSDIAARLVREGVRIVGGCCGTTPEYIKKLNQKIKGINPVKVQPKNLTVVSSYAKAVTFGRLPVLIGERINPTGKKRFKQALLEDDIDYILSEAISQQEKGVSVLDVNVGLPQIDEPQVLKKTVKAIQAVVDLPLQIDTSDPAAMEAALRCYNGKALINSVNGKEESMKAIFPLMKKYGGVTVALTLDDSGIPDTAEGRLDIAKKILSVAESYGIDKKDIIFDPLALTVSADPKAAQTTLWAVKLISEELGAATSLGISNVSYGLPKRDAVNSAFFALALQNGLSAAIMNPYSADMMKTYFAYKALMGLDENCAEYIAASESFADAVSVSKNTADTKTEADGSSLTRAIVKGLKDKAAACTKERLREAAPLDIVNNEIIPALNTVGVGFEKKTVFLPQLLMSAEAAKSAFEVIKSALPEKTGDPGKGSFVIATVRGDIHDIGKNIVKLLLQNYGFNVIDLGKDVPPEKVAETAEKLRAPLVGLSALMTTTVPAMEETINELKRRAPWCRTVVGGAVLTKEYADMIGADKYAKDAMETVRFAEEITDALKN
ncbi:MAG: dihydropteroate synthase, partial [Clostridia bacterium]|nr:dihydropteroate synthase [Clostridia bacterium]